MRLEHDRHLSLVLEVLKGKFLEVYLFDDEQKCHIYVSFSPLNG